MSKTTTCVEQRRQTAEEAAQDLLGELKPTTVAKKAKRLPLLRRWSELAAWQKADDFVRTGYREPTPSLGECVGSWFYLHNESVNIFSHLVGALMFIVMAFKLYEELQLRYTSWSMGDVAAFGVFMFGVAFCFTLSAAFHTCASHSHEGYHLARKLDFQGIVVLVLSTSAPQVYYTFYDEPTLQRNYWCAITAFGLLASIMTFSKSFYEPHKNAVRVAVFAGLGLSTFMPIVHGCLRHGVSGQSHRFPLWAVALTHTFNITGAVVYVSHFPERYWPGRFDLFGASHQLMHTAIICAALTLLVGSIIAFDHANNTPSKGIMSWFSWERILLVLKSQR